jgi:hypothetical protein
MRIVITTSDDYRHLLLGFAHQWNQYCGLPVTVVYRNDAPPPLPPNFITVASPARYYAWSESLANALRDMDDEIVLLGLEDFWLADAVDMDGLHQARLYMKLHPDVQRIDLTEDRAQFPHVMRDGYYMGVFDPAEVQYPLSTQFSLWRREFLIHALDCLHPPGIPPQFEVEASRVVVLEQPVILGTGWKVIPCHGDGVVWNGRLDTLHTEYLKPEDVQALKEKGCL